VLSDQGMQTVRESSVRFDEHTRVRLEWEEVSERLMSYVLVPFRFIYWPPLPSVRRRQGNLLPLSLAPPKTMSSPSDSRLVDPRTARCQKRDKQKSGVASTSFAPSLTNAAVLSQYTNELNLLERSHVELGSREGNTSEGGSRGGDKSEKPNATATKIGETEIGETPSTCYCCFNTVVKELNKTQGFVTDDDLDPLKYVILQGIFPNYSPIGSTKEVKTALAEVKKH
jgi:hypothetical protein